MSAAALARLFATSHKLEPLGDCCTRGASPASSGSASDGDPGRGSADGLPAMSAVADSSHLHFPPPRGRLPFWCRCCCCCIACTTSRWERSRNASAISCGSSSGKRACANSWYRIELDSSWSNCRQTERSLRPSRLIPMPAVTACLNSGYEQVPSRSESKSSNACSTSCRLRPRHSNLSLISSAIRASSRASQARPKLLPTMASGIAITVSPVIITNPIRILPPAVCGEKSPYPTVA
mmetsp:Transcript_25705/g.86659  ORF Transcript_25705/g.86659 Transcript_25705/m.86659 type:complete len:237 (-) Transcript_25705:272-982(-)